MNLPHWSTMFREADGNWSATRVGFLGTLLNINVLEALSFFLQKPLLSIPESVICLVLTLAGLKWVQLPHESAPEPPTAES